MHSSYDPLAAIAESEATGETAAIFAAIRETMSLPLITSIWRTLAGVEGGLPAAWDAARPLYQTGQPAAALVRLEQQASLPVPPQLGPEGLASAGVSRSEAPVVRAIIDAYNRSNGMNLLALTGLIVKPSGVPPDDPVPPAPVWPPLPPVLTRQDMSPDTWTLLRRLNQLGAVPDEPGLATLWRHLAHWPGLLASIEAGMAPLQNDGTIQRSIRQVLDVAQVEGARLAHHRPAVVTLPEDARAMIERYVSHPGLVARMVAIGLGLSRWLPAVGRQPSQARIR